METAGIYACRSIHAQLHCCVHLVNHFTYTLQEARLPDPLMFPRNPLVEAFY